jgi:hypothetical protein
MGLVQEVTEATNAGERKIYTRVCEGGCQKAGRAAVYPRAPCLISRKLQSQKSVTPPVPILGSLYIRMIRLY